MARDLWQEVKSADSDQRRRWTETGGRILYALFIVAGGALALDLYTRPESVLLKFFGVAAAVLLVVSDVFWSWATHHSAAGKQRAVAYVFWALGLVIFALNVVSEYLYHLKQPLGILDGWYFIGSISTVVVAAFGWAIYLTQSPEQEIADVAARAKATAVRGLMRGIDHPDEATKAQLNAPVVQAAADLAQYAAQTVHQFVGALVSKNGATRINTPSAPLIHSLNSDTIPPDAVIKPAPDKPDAMMLIQKDRARVGDDGNGTDPNAMTPRG